MDELKDEQKKLTVLLAETKNSEEAFALKDKIAKNLKLKKKTNLYSSSYLRWPNPPKRINTRSIGF